MNIAKLFYLGSGIYDGLDQWRVLFRFAVYIVIIFNLNDLTN